MRVAVAARTFKLAMPNPTDARLPGRFAQTSVATQGHKAGSIGLRYVWHHSSNMALIHSSPWTHDCSHLSRIEEAGQAVQNCQLLLLVLLVFNVIHQVAKRRSGSLSGTSTVTSFAASLLTCIIDWFQRCQATCELVIASLQSAVRVKRSWRLL